MAKALAKGSRITGAQRSTLASQYAKRYAAGESIRKIVADSGRSYGFVHGVLKESGATLRGRGGATRGVKKTDVGAEVDRDPTKKTASRRPPAKKTGKTATTTKSAKRRRSKSPAKRPPPKTPAKKSRRKDAPPRRRPRRPPPRSTGQEVPGKKSPAAKKTTAEALTDSGHDQGPDAAGVRAHCFRRNSRDRAALAERRGTHVDDARRRCLLDAANDPGSRRRVIN